MKRAPTYYFSIRGKQKGGLVEMDIAMGSRDPQMAEYYEATITVDDKGKLEDMLLDDAADIHPVRKQMIEAIIRDVMTPIPRNG